MSRSAWPVQTKSSFTSSSFETQLKPPLKEPSPDGKSSIMETYETQENIKVGSNQLQERNTDDVLKTCSNSHKSNEPDCLPSKSPITSTSEVSESETWYRPTYVDQAGMNSHLSGPESSTQIGNFSSIFANQTYDNHSISRTNEFSSRILQSQTSYSTTEDLHDPPLNVLMYHQDDLRTSKNTIMRRNGNQNSDYGPIVPNSTIADIDSPRCVLQPKIRMGPQFKTASTTPQDLTQELPFDTTEKAKPSQGKNIASIHPSETSSTEHTSLEASSVIKNPLDRSNNSNREVMNSSMSMNSETISSAHSGDTNVQKISIYRGLETAPYQQSSVAKQQQAHLELDTNYMLNHSISSKRQDEESLGETYNFRAFSGKIEPESKEMKTSPSPTFPTLSGDMSTNYNDRKYPKSSLHRSISPLNRSYPYESQSPILERSFETYHNAEYRRGKSPDVFSSMQQEQQTQLFQQQHRRQPQSQQPHFYQQKYAHHTSHEENHKRPNTPIHHGNSSPYGPTSTRMYPHFDEHNAASLHNKQNTSLKQNSFKLPPRNQNVHATSHHHHNNYHHPNVPLQQQKQRRHHLMQQPTVQPSSQTAIPGGIMSMSPGQNAAVTTNSSNPHQQNRTAPDILKTLLRKKACLYETDTSRAIALITWLVGRRMALNLGYFSRQQLQSGVHYVVSPKITAGIITRTKVNRCMQIILNSCFHYIIPRPDGEEEKGDSFRKQFAATVKGLEDDNLVQALPVPWNDLNVGKALEEWLEIAEDHEEEEESGEGGHKRTVLLCFNENVRSSDDVFRCHNEFIRDAANSANLLLTAGEWKVFFAGGTDQEVMNREVDSAPNSPSHPGLHLRSPSNSPQVKLIPSEDGIMHAPHLLLPSTSTSASSSPIASPKRNPPETTESATDEMLGRMSAFELGKFRTTWCSKRYDHDAHRCGFAHVDVNRGWLRRDPDIYRYRDEICPHIYSTGAFSEMEGCLFNACPKGLKCEYAHSPEEMDYHPNRYKKSLCPNHAAVQKGKGCELRDVCPFLHPPTRPNYREHLCGRAHGHGAHGAHGGYRGSSSANSFQQHNHHPGAPTPIQGQHRRDMPSNPSSSQTGGTRSIVGSLPKGAPMMYVNPAPFSDFDKSLMLPGLQDLFRQRCATMWSHFRDKDVSKYTSF